MFEGAVLYALIGTIGWGLSGGAAKKLIERFGPVRAIVIRNIVATTVLGGLTLFVGIPETITYPMFFFGLFLAISGYFPFILLMTGLGYGKVGVVYPVAEGWVVLAALIGFLFLGDIFSFEKLGALTLIIVGVLLVCIDFDEFRKSDIFSIRSGVPFAAFSAFLWGLIFAFFTIPSVALGGIFFAFMVEGVVLVSAVVHLTLVRREPVLRPRAADMKAVWKLSPYILCAGVGAAVGTSFINFGYATGEVALVSAIAGGHVVIAALFARAMYKEKLNLRQYMGLTVVFLGALFAGII